MSQARYYARVLLSVLIPDVSDKMEFQDTNKQFFTYYIHKESLYRPQSPLLPFGAHNNQPWLINIDMSDKVTKLGQSRGKFQVLVISNLIRKYIYGQANPHRFFHQVNFTDTCFMTGLMFEKDVVKVEGLRAPLEMGPFELPINQYDECFVSP